MGDVGIDEVQLSGLVVLKIIKHCKETLPSLATGQLLGLDVDGILEVTNSFPFPQTEGDDDDEGAEYQMEMIRCLRIVNIDHNTVGWYTSTYLGSFLNLSIIETQFNYQDKIPNSVVVVYDPLRTSQGSLCLRALRLSDGFLELFKKQEFTQESLNKAGLSFADVFEDVPVTVYNSHLVNALLCEFDGAPNMAVDDRRLDLSATPFLEKGLDFLLTQVDALVTEQNRLAYLMRQQSRHESQVAAYEANLRAENEERLLLGDEEKKADPSAVRSFQAPSRLDQVLINSQLEEYCEQLTEFAGQAIEKTYLTASVHNEDA